MQPEGNKPPKSSIPAPLKRASAALSQRRVLILRRLQPSNSSGLYFSRPVDGSLGESRLKDGDERWYLARESSKLNCQVCVSAPVWSGTIQICSHHIARPAPQTTHTTPLKPACFKPGLTRYRAVLAFPVSSHRSQVSSKTPPSSKWPTVLFRPEFASVRRLHLQDTVHPSSPQSFSHTKRPSNASWIANPFDIPSRWASPKNEGYKRVRHKLRGL